MIVLGNAGRCRDRLSSELKNLLISIGSELITRTGKLILKPEYKG